MMANPQNVEALGEKLNVRWKNLAAARSRSTEMLRKLQEALSWFDSSDLSVVVFGSLARGELTQGSDIDWTLLVDGQADPQHLETSLELKGKIESFFHKGPGQEQTFGGMAFSHSLVHDIGGQDDTNKNTTRRILLLLESVAIGRSEAYGRIVTAVLNRYLLEDRAFATSASVTDRVPRFLLNDFARYWRTMAVDFAYKARTRQGKGAAIRNLKLRMSRKLLYVSGLLSCFACTPAFAQPRCGRSDGLEPPAKCVECLRTFMARSPLEIIAGAVLTLGDSALPAGQKIVSAYDEFVGLLADPDRRKHIEDVSPEDMETDQAFREAREVSHRFRDGVLELFFDTDPLRNLTRMYGVF